MSKICLVDAEELEALVERATRRAIGEAIQAEVVQARRTDDWLRFPQLLKRYQIGRKELNELIEQGKLPATVRTFPGGRTGWLVRAGDAERVLGSKRAEA